MRSRSCFCLTPPSHYNQLLEKPLLTRKGGSSQTIRLSLGRTVVFALRGAIRGLVERFSAKTTLLLIYAAAPRATPLRGGRLYPAPPRGRRLALSRLGAGRSGGWRARADVALQQPHQLPAGGGQQGENPKSPPKEKKTFKTRKYSEIPKFRNSENRPAPPGSPGLRLNSTVREANSQARELNLTVRELNSQAPTWQPRPPRGGA
eukprot:1186043-Prorocentrum_minimum.AAC.2